MLKSILNSPLLLPIITGQIRHYVTIAGTALATDGWLTSGETQTGIGAVMVLVGLAWSAISKKTAA